MGTTIMHKQTKFPPPPFFPPPAFLDVLFQTNVMHSFQHLRLIQISFPLRGRCHLLPTLSVFHSHPFNKACCCSVLLPPPARAHTHPLQCLELPINKCWAVRKSWFRKECWDWSFSVAQARPSPFLRVFKWRRGTEEKLSYQGTNLHRWIYRN